MRFDHLTSDATDALRHAGAYASDLVRPNVRLGVTGLARAGKTIFITALVQNLIAGGRLPFLRAQGEGRLLRAWLEPQPDDDVPRFQIEDHLGCLMADPPRWPESTRRISQLRLTLEYAPQSLWRHVTGARRLAVDIVDYPGEWLLDLPLLAQSFETWSEQCLAGAGRSDRQVAGMPFLQFLGGLEATPVNAELVAIKGAELYRDYLRTTRQRDHVYTGLTPGRFLMPGDLDGSPALTFFPLPTERKGALALLLARRFEAYKTHVVKPFFRDHFSRLDRQVVLVDALGALDAGPSVVADLSTSLESVLGAFRPGANTWLSSILARKIDRILFAATKADLLHHTAHDRLEAILGRMVGKAIQRAQFAGAQVRVQAIAGIRATREAEMPGAKGAAPLPCIMGTPMAGEVFGNQSFDGKREIALFPGDLPVNPDDALGLNGARLAGALRFPRFRPPLSVPTASQPTPPFPNIRLDRAIEFLIGDRLA
jgi:uncharacterized protein